MKNGQLTGNDIACNVGCRNIAIFLFFMSDYDDDFFPFCTNIVYFGQDSERPEKAETTTSILSKYDMQPIDGQVNAL